MIAWRGPQAQLQNAVAICLAANVVFAAFLLVRPLSHAGMVAIADPVLVAGLALAACLCLLPLRGNARPSVSRGLLAGVPFLLGGAVMLGAVTAAVFGWYDLVLHHTIPPATIADVTFLAAHPLAFPALLLLPARRLAWLSRARAALDGLLLLAAALTFAWWFIVGPAILAAHQSPLVKLSQAAYPLSDLFVLACLLILVAQFSNATMRPTAVLLTAGLSALVGTDVVYDYQRLHAEYMASSFLDIGWLLSGTLVGLAALALRIALRSSDAGEQDEGTQPIESPEVQLLRALVPQFLVVGVIVLTLVCWALYPHDHRATGLYLGAIAVVGLVLVRQLLAILESARLTSRLEHLATHDPLTGLVNRTLFLDRLSHAITSARRRQAELAVLLIDLDRFKEINDTFGHHQGDRLLTQMAARLRGALRESDTVARLGGDEFAVVMPDTDVRGAEIAAAKLLAALGQAVMVGSRAFESDASIGLASFPAHGDDATALLQRADIAMYAAKRERIGYAVFDPEHDTFRASRVNLGADLRRAIQQGELMLLYQPILDVATGSLRSLEALARWHHPEHGPISPGEFIPLAEQTGLIGALTEWVLLAAHEQWWLWKSAGSAVPIAVNLSARCLFDERISGLISRLAVDPGWLEIEITESSLMADPEQAMDLLRRFHALGITIAIDDFGTGYSSLAYLKRLPADIIKIDRSFVLDMLEHQENSVIVHSVIDLAHNLGLLVTAEGVETAAAAMALQQMGGDLVQGFYFSRPISATEAGAWLASARLAAG